MQNLRRRLPPLSSLLPFEATARLGSITKAGDELGLTQAAISKQIRSLETDIGLQLFERRNRAIYPTEAGIEFARIVTSALEAIGNHAQDLRQQHRDGEVVLRSQLCEGLYWLMPRLSRFYQEHPDIPVRVSVSTEPIAKSSERFDLALQTAGRDRGTARLVHKVSDDVFPVCSPAYLDGMDMPLPVERLQSLQVLHHKVDPQDWIDWDTWLERLGMDFRIGDRGIVYDSYPMMMQAVLEGHGIALGWRRTVEQYMAAGALVQPFREQLQLPDGLSIYEPTGWQVRRGSDVLLDWLKKELSSSGTNAEG